LRLQKQAKKAQEHDRVPSHFLNRLPPAEAKALEIVWLRMLAGVYAKEKEHPEKQRKRARQQQQEGLSTGKALRQRRSETKQEKKKCTRLLVQQGSIEAPKTKEYLEYLPPRNTKEDDVFNLAALS
jgi:hypothetical protein